MVRNSNYHAVVELISQLGFRPRTPPSPQKDTLRLSNSNGLLQNTLIPMFMRNITPAMLFGAHPEDLFELSIPDPASYDFPFSTFQELQMSSFQLRNASAFFARTMATKIFVKTPLTPDDFARQSQLLEAHHSWFRALQKLEQAAFLTPEEEVMAASLRLGYYSTYILIDCAMSLRQTKFDDHIEYFKAINHNAKIVLDSMGIQTPPLPVSSGSRRGFPKNNSNVSKNASSKATPKAGMVVSSFLGACHVLSNFRCTFHLRDLRYPTPTLRHHPLPSPARPP